MLIATFNETTGWRGKTITYEDDHLILEGHGRVSPTNIMKYDEKGQLTWASEEMRAWVGSKAAGKPGLVQSRESGAAPVSDRAPAGDESTQKGGPLTGAAMDQPTCETCPWWRRLMTQDEHMEAITGKPSKPKGKLGLFVEVLDGPDLLAGSGRCHRYPPEGGSLVNLPSDFRATSPTGWCGEHPDSSINRQD